MLLIWNKISPVFFLCYFLPTIPRQYFWPSLTFFICFPIFSNPQNTKDPNHFGTQSWHVACGLIQPDQQKCIICYKIRVHHGYPVPPGQIDSSQMTVDPRGYHDLDRKVVMWISWQRCPAARKADQPTNQPTSDEIKELKLWQAISIKPIVHFCFS